MLTTAICLTTAVFATLAFAYIRGMAFVKQNAPDNMVKFHFIMVAVRFMFAVTAVGLFILFSDNRHDTLVFAAFVVALYLLVMALTIIVKH
jgi:hypothetical protein